MREGAGPGPYGAVGGAGAPRRGASRGGARRATEIVHLGIGAFFRAHGAWYTQHGAEPGRWGISAYTGRSPYVARLLSAQGGRYTLLTLGPDGPSAEVIDTLVRVRPGTDTAAWLADVADPEVRAITVTVTEAGYHHAPDGIDLGHPDVRADLETLRRSARSAPTLRTVAARLVAGLQARAEAGAPPLSVISADNLARNGTRLGASLLALADTAGLVDTAAWLKEAVNFPDSVVDRMTPQPGPAHVRQAAGLTGWADPAAVATEPFSEWVIGRLTGSTPLPPWERAGARLVDDITPFERRKLWLLNAAHSLLAYAGLARGHTTVADAVADPWLASQVEALWNTAVPFVGGDQDDSAGYRARLWERLANPSIGHRLGQIAIDGTSKLPERILPVWRAAHRAGHPASAHALTLGAWVSHVRSKEPPLHDARALELAGGLVPGLDGIRRLLAVLDAEAGDDDDLVAAVADGLRRLDLAAGPPEG